MKFIRVTRPDLGGGGYTQKIDGASDLIDAEFDGAEIGEKIVLELVEMTQEEYDALPEFTGW